jgi:hypothetical protein
MPDISMCENIHCPSKDKCYRYKATPNPFTQTYSKYEVPKRRKKCDYFIKLTHK